MTAHVTLADLQLVEFKYVQVSETISFPCRIVDLSF